ncbi:hypothetical protein [Parablautia muri]|uniref:Bacterial Pleckstrin homology domain-containing protein n=1 Tax=Parablautia muri TaxID=2320879 RepID=A0A9X5BFU6_9FIRM|nr:hypothetical protein [Parablautia muri]NBJ92867.1 hypothetical protein [Parablautia muri]
MEFNQPGRQKNPFIQYRNNSIFMCVIILAVFFFFSRNRTNETVYVLSEEDAVSITGCTGEKITVNYQDLVSVELLDAIDFGEVVDGTDTNQGAAGLWKNERWGEYHLFILHKAKKYIVLTTQEDVVVFNYESTDVTRNLYNALNELMVRKGLEGQIQFLSEEQE